MTKNEIVTQLARRRVVEGLCLNVAHTGSLNADLQDLAQYVYVVLLQYDDAKVLAMWQAGALPFFLSRIIVNQYRSTTSNFHRTIRAFRARSTSYSPLDYDAERVAEALR